MSARLGVEIRSFFAQWRSVSLDHPYLGTWSINSELNFSCFDFIFIYNLRLYEVTRLTIEVQVRDNNVEAAIRILKKKLLREGIFKELKLRKNYEKPSERKLREKAESIKRFKKLMRKKKFD